MPSHAIMTSSAQEPIASTRYTTPLNEPAPQSTYHATYLAYLDTSDPPPYEYHRFAMDVPRASISPSEASTYPSKLGKHGRSGSVDSTTSVLSTTSRASFSAPLAPLPEPTSAATPSDLPAAPDTKPRRRTARERELDAMARDYIARSYEYAFVPMLARDAGQGFGAVAEEPRGKRWKRRIQRWAEKA